tara:strand:+ start:312 stop:1499 length:1188 start_codon:yes stop_codon:yes gene_type:complete
LIISEPHKLLNRSEKITEFDFKMNTQHIERHINDKSILVIGAAGSIGSAVVKKIMKYNPKKLFLVDNNENGLVDLIRFLRSSEHNINKTELKILPSSVDSEIFRLFLIKNKPFDSIFNFAARKHVRTEEDVYSSLLLFKINLIDTYKLLGFVKDQNISNRYFAVSTDKAADPFNLMGASKRLMEASIFLSGIESYSTRFANVAFSKGSLLASFPQRIANNQPIPVPNKIKRFLITESEAAEICLLSAFSTPKNSVLIPKSGLLEEIELKGILENYLNTLDLKPEYFDNKDMAIKFLDQKNVNDKKYPVVLTEPVTTGEKISEKFLASDEVTKEHLENFDIILSQERNEPNISHFINDFENITNEKLTKKQIVDLTLKYLPTMSHKETNKSLNSQI